MENIIRPKELADKLGIGLSTLYERMKEPDFPRKIQISKNAVGFRESEIMSWLEEQTETTTKSKKRGDLDILADL